MPETLIAKDNTVYAKAQAAEKDFFDLWKAIVDIDSPTGYGEGLVKVGNIVCDELRATGAQVETYPAAGASEGMNVSGSLKGHGGGSILLLAHMDTVHPVGSVAKRPFRIDSDGKAHGPGVSDDKSSVVQVLQALKILRDLEYKGYAKITFLANCDEENGSLSSQRLIQQLAREHDYVLCVESGRPGDAIVVGRPGSANLKIEVKGLMAHASNPQAGRNAADEVVHQVSCLNQLADKEKGTVLTTRAIESGTSNLTRSVVPDQGFAVLRVGACSAEEMHRVETAAAELAKRTLVPGIEVSATFTPFFPPFPKSEATMKLAGLAQAIYAGLGLNLKLQEVPSCSDACFASMVNAATLDSLGPVSGGKNHTEQEWADANSVIPRLYLMTKMLMELGGRGQ